ncbi:MAG: hypothetical protein CME71_06905 [Halobacteriovorax sp.]|nr:hypothetical protein [Halobacteriovorax sp.]
MKLFIFAFILSFKVFAVYDQDNRVDFYKLYDPKLKELAKSVAFQIYKDELRGWTFQRYWTIVTRPLSARGVCENERFADQPTMRNDCSGVLVGAKTLLMPGHCITEHYCWNDLFYFMFNYHQDEVTTMSLERHKDNFYKCEKVIKRVYNPQTAVSYALIELNREVKGIKPAKISTNLRIEKHTELVVMGHPDGLPLKIAGDAFVTDEDDSHFVVSSDIAGSSKGSAVFNLETSELEGFLISGRNDYEVSSSGCKRAPVYPYSEAKELGLKAASILNL